MKAHFGVDADTGLVHRRIALAAAVLGRARRVDDGLALVWVVSEVGAMAAKTGVCCALGPGDGLEIGWPRERSRIA